MAGNVREQLPRRGEEWRWKRWREAGGLTHVVKVRKKNERWEGTALK